MKRTLAFVTASLFGLAFSLGSLAAISFTDSFENNDYGAKSKNMLSWSKTNVASVIEAPGTNMVRDGSRSLRLQGTEWVEQRFQLDEAYPELWFRFWVKVPVNYEHTHPNASSNRKFFAIWMDGYSGKGEGATVVWEFWKDGNKGSNIAIHWSQGNYSNAGGHQQHQPFISYPSDQGKWMQVVLRVKAASTRSTADGEIEMWRRWAGEDKFTQLHKVTKAKLPPPSSGPQGWNAGYLLGWANANYLPGTQWHFDDFTVSTGSLLQAEGASPPAPPQLSIGS